MDVRILLSAKQTADHSHIEGREGGRERGEKERATSDQSGKKKKKVRKFRKTDNSTTLSHGEHKTANNRDKV